jgi:hypothetical protein
VTGKVWFFLKQEHPENEFFGIQWQHIQSKNDCRGKTRKHCEEPEHFAGRKTQSSRNLPGPNIETRKTAPVRSGAVHFRA